MTCGRSDCLIDFPCSPNWLQHYHRLGLTPLGCGPFCPVHGIALEGLKLEMAPAEREAKAMPDLMGRFRALERDIKALQIELGRLRAERLKKRPPKGVEP